MHTLLTGALLTGSLRRRVLLLWALGGALWSLWAQADAGVDELVSQLKQGQVADAELRGVQSADGLFLLGWLYQQGSYGVGRDPQRGRELMQQAAERGQFDAMHYCWRECLDLTPEVLEQLRLGVERHQPQALYLQSQLANAGGRLTADQLLLEAARLGHPEAIGRLYADHLVTWAKQRRTLDAAVTKLQRCVAEGVTICYFLLGALYERHNDHQQALFNYQLLALVDPALYRQYLGTEQLQRLLAYLPQPSLALLQSRAASYLAQRDLSGNQQLDRFKRCGADYPCVRQLSLSDQSCVLSYFEASHLAGLRDSEGYRACQAEFAPH